jgi:hypothetical protein
MNPIILLELMPQRRAEAVFGGNSPVNGGNPQFGLFAE